MFYKYINLLLFSIICGTDFRIVLKITIILMTVIYFKLNI